MESLHGGLFEFDRFNFLQIYKLMGLKKRISKVSMNNIWMIFHEIVVGSKGRLGLWTKAWIHSRGSSLLKGELAYYKISISITK